MIWGTLIIYATVTSVVMTMPLYISILPHSLFVSFQLLSLRSEFCNRPHQVEGKQAHYIDSLVSCVCLEHNTVMCFHL